MPTYHRVLFEKPDLPQLNREYTVVDLHFHSIHSDGHNSIASIADRARELGIGIAITDHNEIRGAVELAGRRDVFSIPGIEVTSAEGTHVLIYFYRLKELEVFYRRDILPHMGADVMSSTGLVMEAVLERARCYETVVIFPHPYCGSYTGIHNSYFPPTRFQKILTASDGIEGINSENLKKWNMRCALLGFNLGKAITGGSDGHRLNQLGRVVSYADCKPGRRAFLDAVKQRRNGVVGKEIDLIRKVRSNTVKLRNSFRNYPDIMEKNIRYFNAKSKLFKENVRRNFEERMRENLRKYHAH
jgi:predicted metal-dependent phosphoesterase TrpH